MISLLFSNPLIFFIAFGGLIISLTIHEFAHAWTADKLGDPTPRLQGRVTLDPRAHLDPLGTVMILLTRFGWGKPVQFDPYNLKHPVRDSAIIALAGPASNLLLAGVLSLILYLQILPFTLLEFAFAQIIVTNVVLAIFNLVPVYPLDGSKILVALLPKEAAFDYDRFMSQYGIFVLLALIFPWYQGMAPISFLISPVIQFMTSFLLPSIL